jgi:hypothetical protein
MKRNKKLTTEDMFHFGLLGALWYVGIRAVRKGKASIPSDSLSTPTKSDSPTSPTSCGKWKFGSALITMANEKPSFKNKIQNFQNHINLMLITKGIKGQGVKADGYFGACTYKSSLLAFPKTIEKESDYTTLAQVLNHIEYINGALSSGSGVDYRRFQNTL